MKPRPWRTVSEILKGETEDCKADVDLSLLDLSVRMRTLARLNERASCPMLPAPPSSLHHVMVVLSDPDALRKLQVHKHRSPRLQTNTEIYPGEDPRKYEVGARLRFLGYANDEVFSVEGYDPSALFTPGDILVPVERNGCGMGIDVRRLSDDRVDMVWAEEVEVVPDEEFESWADFAKRKGLTWIDPSTEEKP